MSHRLFFLSLGKRKAGYKVCMHRGTAWVRFFLVSGALLRAPAGASQAAPPATPQQMPAQAPPTQATPTQATPFHTAPPAVEPARAAKHPRPRRGGCQQAPLPAAPAAAPFLDGESLRYDISLLGLRLGQASLRVRHQGGDAPYRLEAQAQTEGFFSVLGSLDGVMTSTLDATTWAPTSMRQRFLIYALGRGETEAREEASFAGRAVRGRLSYRFPDGKRLSRPARLWASSDVLDVISVAFYMRTRTYAPNTQFCFEIYHRRVLWRVEGQVGAEETFQTPAGTQRAIPIAGVLYDPARKDTRRAIQAWVSADPARVPLGVDTPDTLGTLSLRLTERIPGKPRPAPAPAPDKGPAPGTPPPEDALGPMPTGPSAP